MKPCSYCGREYPDDAVRCQVDQQPLVGGTETHEKAGSEPDPARTAFDATLVSPFRSSGTYRVYLRGSDLIFIQTDAGVRSGWPGQILAHLWPVGILVNLFWWVSSKRRTWDSERLDEADPEDLLRESESNFKIYLLEIQDAALEPPAHLSTSGTKAGRLWLFLPGGRKITLAFGDADEIKTALRLLTPRLGSTLRVNVKWNEGRQRFQGKRSD